MVGAAGHRDQFRRRAAAGLEPPWPIRCPRASWPRWPARPAPAPIRVAPPPARWPAPRRSAPWAQRSASASAPALRPPGCCRASPMPCAISTMPHRHDAAPSPAPDRPPGSSWCCLLAGFGLGVLPGRRPAAAAGQLARRDTCSALSGSLLTGLGWWWMQRLIRRADPPETGRVDPSVVLELIAGALESGLAAGAVRRLGRRSRCPRVRTSETLGRLAGALDAGLPAVLATAELPSGVRRAGESAVLAESAGADLARVLRSAARDARRGRARDAEVRAAQLAGAPGPAHRGRAASRLRGARDHPHRDLPARRHFALTATGGSPL